MDDWEPQTVHLNRLSLMNCLGNDYCYKMKILCLKFFRKDKMILRRINERTERRRERNFSLHTRFWNLISIQIYSHFADLFKSQNAFIHEWEKFPMLFEKSSQSFAELDKLHKKTDKWVLNIIGKVTFRWRCCSCEILPRNGVIIHEENFALQINYSFQSRLDSMTAILVCFFSSHYN